MAEKIRIGCAARDTAFLKDFSTKFIICPDCGHEVEFFSDEKKVKCTICGKSVFKLCEDIVSYQEGCLVFREKEKSCIDWCGACLEKNDFDEVRKNNEFIDLKKEKLKKLINLIDKDNIRLIQFFIESFKKNINHPELINPLNLEKIRDEDKDILILAKQIYNKFKKENPF
jgi:hypothetical protein